MSEGIRGRERFSPAQSRAARGLLSWTTVRLASVAGFEPEAIELYEAGEGDLSAAELVTLGRAFNQAGVIAIAEREAGEGVRLRFPSALPDWPDRCGSPAMARRVANLVGELAADLTAWPGERGRVGLQLKGRPLDR